MRESSIAMSRRQHLSNDTESHRVRMRISTAEVASAKKQNVLFKKNTPPHTHTHIRLHKHYLQLLLEPLSYLRETENQGDRKFFFAGGGGGCKQGLLWEMRKWRIGESRRGENGYERRSTMGRGTRDAKAGEEGV